jgi:hypothetical protein
MGRCWPTACWGEGSMRRARPRSTLLIPMVLLLFVTRCSSGWRQDELECEQAANQLIKCCPGFDAESLSCTYSEGCGTSYPALTVADSRCIDNESCDTLVATGVCTRAAEALPIQTTDGGLTNHPQVCP